MDFNVTKVGDNGLVDATKMMNAPVNKLQIPVNILSLKDDLNVNMQQRGPEIEVFDQQIQTYISSIY
jgi:hypothetical protein